MQQPQRMEDQYVEEPPVGATALNGMSEVQAYECSDCGAIVYEAEIEHHRCG